MRPVCVECGKEMACETAGVLVYHPMERTNEPAIREVGEITVINVDAFQTVKEEDIDFVVYGDKYKCPVCGYEIIASFGAKMYCGQFSQKDLKKTIRREKDKVRILYKR